MEYEHLLGDLPFTRLARVERAAHTLEGLVLGIAIDEKINEKELGELKAWADDHRPFIKNHPFNELLPVVERALADGVLDEEEQKDLLWLCRNLQIESGFFDDITDKIQRLHGIFHGLLADGSITDEEVIRLKEWIEENDDLRGTFPYDDLDAIIVGILRDGRVDEGERAILEAYLTNFVSFSMKKRLGDARAGLKAPAKLSGICAVDPEITFAERHFCWTGTSTRMERSKIKELIISRGGKFTKALSTKVDYLVVGANGNPVWTFTCYGRKVEEAMAMRGEGHPIRIVHETDFWDAME